jgi:hypothetical protein
LRIIRRSDIRDVRRSFFYDPHGDIHPKGRVMIRTMLVAVVAGLTMAAVLVKIGAHPPVADAALKAAATVVLGRL